MIDGVVGLKGVISAVALYLSQLFFVSFFFCCFPSLGFFYSVLSLLLTYLLLFLKSIVLVVALGFTTYTSK